MELKDSQFEYLNVEKSKTKPVIVSPGVKLEAE